MSEYSEATDEADDRAPGDNEPLPGDSSERKRSSIWLLIALAVLGLILIWIILGVWRYLQVLGYGGS